LAFRGSGALCLFGGPRLAPAGGVTYLSPGLLLVGGWVPARAMTEDVGVALRLKPPPPAAGPGLGLASCLGFGRGSCVGPLCGSGPWPGLVCRGPSGPATQSAQGPPEWLSLLFGTLAAFGVTPRGEGLPLGPGAPPGT